MCEVDTVKAVSQRYHLDRQTVKAVDKLQLDHCFGEIELGNVRHLIMDEFAIQKGHKYATIVMDAETHRALWVCKGKAGADVKAFFELLKEKKLADKIRSVSMDMNACFSSLVRHYCHNATVLYDLFHGLQMFTRNVLVPAKKHCQDAVLKRLDSLNTPPKPAKKKGDDATPKAPVVISKEILEQHAQERKRLTEQKELLTSCQWVLVRSFNDLDNDDTEKLQKLRNNNQLLADLYPIADLLRNLWTEKNRCEVLKQIRHLMGLCWAIARTHGFKPPRTIAEICSCVVWTASSTAVATATIPDLWRAPITPSRCSSAPLTVFWISTTSASRFLPAYQGAATPEALCYTDASTDLWPSLKPVFSSVVFIQIQDEPSVMF